MDNINSKEQNIDVQIHYYLFDAETHQMDARVHNDCEHQFLLALDILKTYIGDFKVDVGVRKEGGVIDEFFINVAPGLVDFSKIIITAFITYYFTKKQNRRDDVLKDIDIVEKLKEKNVSKEEAEAFVSSIPALKKHVSKYYSCAEKEPLIQQIETSITGTRDSKQSYVACINRTDFVSHIIETDTTEKTETIEGTTIAILSPILQKGHGKTWHGIFSGKTIDFKIEDKEFLQQVYDNEIKFGAATVIKCSLKIKRRETKTDEDPRIREEFEYMVTYVQSWQDDEHYQIPSKRYKRIKAEENQLSLFSDNKNTE